MRVFISWSGDHMREVAEILRSWIPTILQMVEPWVSSQDIAAGARPMNVLGSELASTQVGIICISPTTQHAPWVNFEAGALSKSLAEGKVIPFLVGLSAAEIRGPLSNFQAVDSRKREDVERMLSTINGELSVPIKVELLQKMLDSFWPELETRLGKLIDAVQGVA